MFFKYMLSFADNEGIAVFVSNFKSACKLLKNIDKKDFHISNFEYKTIDLELFKKSINKNDRIQIKIDSSDKYKLNRETIVNNFTYVYGLAKNNSQFIDLEKTKKLKDEDTKIAFFFLGLGLIILPYAFIKRNVELRFEMMILTYIFLSVIIYSILKVNKLI